MNLRKIREAAQRLAVSLDTTIERVDTGSLMVLNIDAPEGKVWSDGCVTSLRIDGRPTSGEDRAQMYQDAINRMNAGLEDADHE